MMTEIPGLTISESEYALEKGGTGKIAVFIYAGKADPSKVLDLAIHQYVETNGYHELIDANLDNPWMRVVLSDINSMSQEPYNSMKHKLKQKNN
jgi:hypothetical protein